MDITQFDRLMFDLNWQDKHLSHRLGLNKNTITGWRKRGVIPKYAQAYLQLSHEVLHLSLYLK